MNYYHLDEQAKQAYVGICLPEEETWGKECGTEALRLLMDHLFSEMALEEVRAATCPVSVYRITGQVTDFDARPFPAYIWAVEQPYADRPQAMAKTDPEGHFTLWYPEGRRMRVFIDDESYSRTTYECWITIEALKGDVEIDPQVRNFELWGLHAWRAPMAWQVYFWPCSLLMDLLSKRPNWKLDHRPRLRREDIMVRIEGTEVPVEGLHIVDVWAGDGIEYPAHLLELPLHKRGCCAPTVIEVEVQTRTCGSGEAWYVVW